MKYNEFKSITGKDPELEKRFAEFLKPVLTDFKDIPNVAGIFYDYHHIQAKDLKKRKNKRSKQEKAELAIKFLTLCLFIFDPETINPAYEKRMQPYMRRSISKFLNINPSLLSQYLPRAKVYMRVYTKFATDVMQMISIVKVNKTKNLFMSK